ncbi:hypothetical protein V6N13_098349 [Hibiscus sabdariffa]
MIGVFAEDIDKLRTHKKNLFVNKNYVLIGSRMETVTLVTFTDKPLPESKEIKSPRCKSLTKLGAKMTPPSTGGLSTIFSPWLGDNGGGIHKLLAIAVHAVLIESGFVGFDPVSGLQTDGFRFPEEFVSPVSLCYSLPALLRANVTDYVVLRFLSVGRFIQVYGSLVKGSGIHRLSLDEHRFSPTLDLVRANSSKSDGHGSLNFSLENHVMEFWRIVKDGLALPLLTDLCSKTHLALPACFVRLPTELKLQILDSLPGTDVARMECVCS